MELSTDVGECRTPRVCRIEPDNRPGPPSGEEEDRDLLYALLKWEDDGGPPARHEVPDPAERP